MAGAAADTVKIALDVLMCINESNAGIFPISEDHAHLYAMRDLFKKFYAVPAPADAPTAKDIAAEAVNLEVIMPSQRVLFQTLIESKEAMQAFLKTIENSR